jgi:choline kinase
MKKSLILLSIFILFILSNFQSYIQTIYYFFKNKEKNVIVSFTTYKNRLLTKAVNEMINSLMKQSIYPFKIVMTLYKDDVKYVNKYIQSLIDKKIIELIVANIDLKPHNKYFYTMKKYRNHPIITVDDDIVYEKTTVESLLNSYLLYPNYISARRVHKMLFDKNNKLMSYANWTKEYNKELKPSFNLFATGVGGVLYPPNILNINDDLIPEIKKCLNADDIYLKYLEIKKKIKTIYVKNNKPIGYPNYNSDVQEKALYKLNKFDNDKYIKLFNIVYPQK